MFGFFKKEKSQDESLKQQERMISPAEREKLGSEAMALEKEIKEKTGSERIGILNQLGECYFQMQDYDRAIDWFEKSLEEDASLGKAHTSLMKLYNIKRREAAQKKDGNEVQMYLDKMDKLTNLSKDSMRKGKF